MLGVHIVSSVVFVILSQSLATIRNRILAFLPQLAKLLT